MLRTKFVHVAAIYECWMKYDAMLWWEFSIPELDDSHFYTYCF
jgi:hypothetical protein